tara:strand:- start:6793 stop:7089 length:297 start_codon:yes stop_codon:yes gene_type:complete
LKDKGIPLPKDATVEELQHRLDTWESGKGYLVRPAKLPRNLAKQLEPNMNYWIPNSNFARQMIKSQEVFLLTRCNIPKRGDFELLDVPKLGDSIEEEE